jgi:hypothetical protein
MIKVDFDPTEHPRVPKGEGGGGEFAPKGGGGGEPAAASAAEAPAKAPAYDRDKFFTVVGARRLVEAYPGGDHDLPEIMAAAPDDLKGKALYDFMAAGLRAKLSGADRDKFDHAMTAVRIAELRERKKAGVFEPGKKIGPPRVSAAPVAPPAPRTATVPPKPAAVASVSAVPPKAPTAPPRSPTMEARDRAILDAVFGTPAPAAPETFWEGEGMRRLKLAYPGPDDDPVLAFDMAGKLGLSGKKRYDYVVHSMRGALMRAEDKSTFDRAVTAIRIAELRERKKAAGAGPAALPARFVTVRPTSGVPMPGPGMRPDGGLGAAPAPASALPDLTPDEVKPIEAEVAGDGIRAIYLRVKAKIGKNDKLYALQHSVTSDIDGVIEFRDKAREIAAEKLSGSDLETLDNEMVEMTNNIRDRYAVKIREAREAKVPAPAPAPRPAPAKPGAAAAKPHAPLKAPPADPAREYIRKAEKPLYQAKGEDLENARNHAETEISDWARRHKTTVASARKKVLDYFRASVKDKPLCKRTGIDAMTRVIDGDGRFKTQFETGRSEGCLSPSHRNRAEMYGMGFKDGVKITPHLRPIYGYIEGAGSDAESYGEIKLVMKEEVKKRTTITCGDSLGDFANGSLCGTPLLNPDIEGLDGEVEDLMDHPRGAGLKGWSSYMEAQITGGVELAEVQKVVFHSSCFEGEWGMRGGKPQLSDRYKIVEAKLKDMGIEVEYAPDTR